MTGSASGRLLAIGLAASAACASGETILHDDCASSDPRVYVALRASPAVDGSLNDWAGVCPIEVHGPEATAVYRLAWDDQALYIASEVADATLYASVTTRDRNVWTDDSVEVNFDVSGIGGSTSMPRADNYKLIVNILGTEGDSQGGRDPRAAWDVAQVTGIELDGGPSDSVADQGYRIEQSISWSSWGVEVPGAGTEWGFDIVLNNKSGDESAVQTPWANSSGQADNVPDHWGRILFIRRRP
jgi:hypothetical protein